MSGLPDDETAKFGLYQWHKSVGLLVMMLAIARLIWRTVNPSPELPLSFPSWERHAARLTHNVLYAALLAIPLAGWAFVSASPLGIPTFAFYLVLVPHLPVPVSASSEALFGMLHGLLAFSTVLLVMLHIAAALRHHLILKNEILARMIKPARRHR